MRVPAWIAQYWTALRALLVFTAITGIAYPLVITGVAGVPGLRHDAGGSIVTAGGRPVGSSLIGQRFTDARGNPLVQYFQSRPSAAGTGYDPTASGASNLGPEDIVDRGKPSLLTQVCARSLAVGALEGVSGARPYCTAGGAGAVLGVFHADGASGRVTGVVSLNQECPATPFLATYQGVAVRCAVAGADYRKAVITPIRGDAPTDPAVPPDAVTASGSGLDPQISPAYAELQAPRIARVRGTGVAEIDRLIQRYTAGRVLGFMGEPGVEVLPLNIALDRAFPYHAR